MGLFGFKKVKEEPKSSGMFINEDVINAADYSNMPNNTIIGYNQPTEETENIESNNSETFVYSQVNVDDYNSQFITNLGPSAVEQDYYNQNNNYDTQIDTTSIYEQSSYNEFSSADVPVMSQEFSGTDMPVVNQEMSLPEQQEIYYNQDYSGYDISMPVVATEGYNEFSSADVPVTSEVTFNNEFSSVDVPVMSQEFVGVDMPVVNQEMSLPEQQGTYYNQEYSGYDVNMPVEATEGYSEFSSADSPVVGQEFSSADSDVSIVNQEIVNYETPLPVSEATAVKEFIVPDITNVEPVEGDSSNNDASDTQDTAKEEVLEETEEIEELVLHEDIVYEEPKIVLDPLDNANNPVPVNPVALEEEKKEENIEEEDNIEDDTPLFDEEEEVKTNLFTVINMMIGVVIKPGSTISLNAKKYKKLFDALSITFWVTMLSFVMSLAGRIVAGCFSKTENAISGASKIHLDFTGLVDTNNYVPYLVITLLIGLVVILVIALVYYIASFICSKGIPIGTYFAISTLSVVPIIIGFTILHPLVNIISTGAALMVLVFSVIYAIIILFTGINRVLKFKNNDSRIIYNAVNMAIIVSVMIFIFNTLSRLNILDLVMFL